MFYCRDNELRKLNKLYASDKFECVIIYGRRRVGKTALINEFCKDKPTIFFSALNASANENLEAFSKAIYQLEHPEISDTPLYQSFDAALERITNLSQTRRAVLVIDEYPYLARSYESISSRLQHIIDHHWQNGKLFLILCGSSMSFMENQVLGYESPLYGRRTAQFKIQALSYKDICAFEPTLGFEEQSLVYGITGGIPMYVSQLGAKGSVDDALINNLFDSSAYLFEEPQNLLKQELREPAMYNSVISAIAGGASRINEIAQKVGIESAVCSKYLTGLIELGILKKEYPITEKNGKKTIYLIDDCFFRFWYRFVPRNLAAVESGRFAGIYDRAVKPYLHDYMGLVFERICRDYLLRYAEDLPVAISEIGQWWGSDPATHKEVQIDIVAASADGNEYIIGSCKYRDKTTGVDEYELLKHYADVFGKGSRYHYYIFSKSGFTNGLKELAKKENLHLLELDDLYK